MEEVQKASSHTTLFEPLPFSAVANTDCMVANSEKSNTSVAVLSFPRAWLPIQIQQDPYEV